MSKKKPIREDKAVWRVRGIDGKWREFPEGERPNIKLSGYVWSPCITGDDGIRILNFIMN